jgi:hypothetical protein
LFIYLFLIATKILIAGGRNHRGSYSSSYILRVTFDGDHISATTYIEVADMSLENWMCATKYIEVADMSLENRMCATKYIEVENMPLENWMCFYQNCQGRNIIGGGRGSRPGDFLQNVIELVCSNATLELPKWSNIPLLNVIRDKCPASCYIANTYLMVAGGYHPTHGLLNSIELLNVPETATTSDEEDNGHRHSITKWNLCATTLPVKVQAHTLSYFKGKIYLIGGNSGRNTNSNQAWKGSFDLNTKEFIFVEISPMKEERVGHFSIVVKDKIYVFGGEKVRYNSVVEVYDGKSWSDGPQFPFSVDRHHNNAVLNKHDNIIVLTNKHGTVIYNPTEKTIKMYNDFKLKDEREYYAALLI